MKNIKVFADTANMQDIEAMAALDIVEGFTTNPTLMLKSPEITTYKGFAQQAIAYLKEHKPNGCISLEVFADSSWWMIQEALEIKSWAIGVKKDYNVYVKIPIINIKGQYNDDVIEQLLKEKVNLNVTACFTSEQYGMALKLLSTSDPKNTHIISMFAGRMHDAGFDAVELLKPLLAYRLENVDILWASSRQVYDYVLADKIGMDIITMTPDLIRKIPRIGTPLKLMTLDTVRMFSNDAKKTGFRIVNPVDFGIPEIEYE